MALIEALGFMTLFMLLLCGNLSVIEAFAQQKKALTERQFRTVQN